nr:MAG TPA: hypothetical protein [Caudoviricetes sp.]
MTGAEIIANILSYSKLNVNSFSEKIGLKRAQAIYDIQKGKTKGISKQMSSKIISVFPEINRVYLLTGEGEMLKSEHVAAAPAAGSTASTPPMSDDIRKLRDEISRLSGEVAELRKVILAQNSQLIELLKSEKSR